MDEQRTVATLIGKEAVEEVKDKNYMFHKCPFSHGEAMQKMDDYLALYCC